MSGQNEKPIREPVSKKTRFEVFKRDHFTCQYCGAKAPEAVLQCDHVLPVAKGGKSEILNLVTACSDCNGGKGARTLDDRSTLERQRAQIESLQERREQLEMMLQWRDQAEAERVDVVEEIATRISERGGYYPNASGEQHIRRWLKRFTVPEILSALDESFDHYMRWEGEAPDLDAWELAFAKIPAIASLRQQAVSKPYMPRLAYIQGIVRNRINDRRFNCIEALEEYHLEGISLATLEAIARGIRSWGDFTDAAEPIAEKLAGGDDGSD